MATYNGAATKKITGFDTYVSGKSVWHTTAGDVAQQGSYGGSDTYSRNFRVGLMFWSDMGATLKNTIIKSVKIKCTFASAGYGYSSKKNVRFYTCKYNSYDSSKNPSDYIGTVIETFNSQAYDNTATFTFTTSGAGWTALTESLSSGIGALLVYNTDDKATSSGDIGTDYLQINSATITVEYEQGAVQIYTSSGWQQAIPYIYTSSGWQQAIPYINTNGTSSGWTICN